MDFLYQFFSSRVHITASGSSGPTPRRSQPLDCWLPVHTRYNWANRSVDQKPIDAAMARAVPGSFPRTVDSLKAKGGKAVVYDRDIITTWRLPDTISGHEVFFLEKAFEDAISHETLFVALGAFAEQGGPSLRKYIIWTEQSSCLYRVIVRSLADLIQSILSQTTCYDSYMVSSRISARNP